MISFPPDLYAEIASQSTLEALLQLCHCSRSWYSVAASQLYSNISWELYDTVAVGFMHTIASNKWLGSKVSSLNIRWKFDQAHLFAPALRNMPNLEHLRAYELSRSWEANPACVDTFLSLKKLRSIALHWCDSLNTEAVFDRLHPLHRIAWEWDGHTSDALEHLIARSHKVLQELELIEYPLENVLTRFAHSIVFSRLATISVKTISVGAPLGGRFPALCKIVVTDTISLRALIGNPFPALCKIAARYITDMGLLRDPKFLPALRSVSLWCNDNLEDTASTHDSDEPGHIPIPLRAERHLASLELNLRDINPPSVEAEDPDHDVEIDRLKRYLEPLRLSKLSSLSIIATTSAQIELVAGCLDCVLRQEHELRVLVVQIEFYCDDLTSASRSLWDLTTKALFQRLRYFRLMVRERDDPLQEQMGLALHSMPLVNIAHLGTLENESEVATMCAWIRSGGGWDEWKPAVDPYDTMLWPYWILGLEGEELLDYIDSTSA